MIVDAGFLIALERGQHNAMRIWRAAINRGLELRVPATVEAQVIREVQRQVLLLRALDAMISVPLDRRSARAVGALLARTGTTDVVDAHVAVLAAAHPGPVVTSGPDDLVVLGIHPDRLISV